MIWKQHNIHLKSLGIIDYFWLCFTVLTAIWHENEYVIGSLKAHMLYFVDYLHFFINLSKKTSSYKFALGVVMGSHLIKRPFMYVNIFWTMMPLYIIIKNLT